MRGTQQTAPLLGNVVCVVRKTETVSCLQLLLSDYSRYMLPVLMPIYLALSGTFPIIRDVFQ